MYYYLGAMLPALWLEKKPPLTLAAFHALCRQHLGKDDLRAVDQIAGTDTGPHLHPALRAWHAAETRLRAFVARARASRRGVAVPHGARDAAHTDPLLERMVADAMARTIPTERELALDRVRWNLIEDIAGLNPFTGEAIVAYGLKLKLIERWAAFSEEAGTSLAEKLVAQEVRS